MSPILISVAARSSDRVYTHGRGWLAALILAALTLVVAVRPAAMAEEGSANPVRLLVLGDSLSAAYGLAVEQGWVALLDQRLRAEAAAGSPPVLITNASISGETTAGGLERLPELLAQHQPDVLILELGANDGLRGFALTAVADRLERLIALGQASQARVLLLGLRLPPNYGAAYSDGFQRMFSTVAAQTGALLVPRMLAGIAEQRDLMQSDGLHPNAAAQLMILDTVWPSVRALLPSHTDAAINASGQE